MKSIETQGKTVDQAIELGLYKLNTTRDQVKITILEEAGLFNKARVRLTLNITSKEEEEIKELATALLSRMNLNVEITVEDTDEYFLVNISGKDAALAIGKHGDCLEAIGYLLNTIYNKDKNKDETKRIMADSDNYRQRRQATLVVLAKKMASKAIRTGKDVKLEPMSSFERRIIHNTLQQNTHVETQSQGNEPNRFVVIKLKADLDKRKERREIRKKEELENKIDNRDYND